MITEQQLPYANEAYILLQAINHLKFKRTRFRDDPARAAIYKMVIDDLEKDMKEVLNKIGETYLPNPSIEGGVNVNPAS